MCYSNLCLLIYVDQGSQNESKAATQPFHRASVRSLEKWRLSDAIAFEGFGANWDFHCLAIMSLAAKKMCVVTVRNRVGTSSICKLKMAKAGLGNRRTPITSEVNWKKKSSKASYTFTGPKMCKWFPVWPKPCQHRGEWEGGIWTRWQGVRYQWRAIFCTNSQCCHELLVGGFALLQGSRRWSNPVSFFKRAWI